MSADACCCLALGESGVREKYCDAAKTPVIPILVHAGGTYSSRNSLL